MKGFEELPDNIRALLMVRLFTELNSEKCEDIHDLARKRESDATRVWRDICRKAGQPLSAMPVEIEGTRKG